ncbi:MULTISPECIES: NUDIX domain-containing protein [unclassified Streptomyces]|uniref:NUDIX domain-containing protein n=1 Tax=unclassified Streptomyces TaxID=2593676 RepID=UPI0034410D3C
MWTKRGPDPGQVSRFPGHYEVMARGAVAAGESYEEAAVRELAEELGIDTTVRSVVKFLNRGGLSPYWLGIHEAVVLVDPKPRTDEVAWHGWLPEAELHEFMRRHPFTPDSRETWERRLRLARFRRRCAVPGRTRRASLHPQHDTPGLLLCCGGGGVGVPGFRPFAGSGHAQ